MKFNSLFVEFSYKNRKMYKLRDQMFSVQLNDINKEIINKYGIDIANRNSIIRSLVQFLSQGDILKNEKLEAVTQPYYIIRTDIAKFFPSINKHKLYKKIIKSSILNDYSIEVIKSFIFKTKVKGIPIGTPFSNTLAELYLEEFDRNVQILFKPLFYVRYVDDILIIKHIEDSSVSKVSIKDNVQNFDYEILLNLLDKFNLKLNKEKTEILVRRNGQDSIIFDYLGYEFNISNRILTVDISEKKFFKKILNKVIRSFKKFLSSSKDTTEYWILYYRLKNIIYGVTTSGKNNHIKFGIGYSYKFINTDKSLKILLKTFHYFVYRITPNISRSQRGKLLSLITIEDNGNYVILNDKNESNLIIKLLNKRVNYTKMSNRTLENIFRRIGCSNINYGNEHIYHKNLQVQIMKKLSLKL